MSVPIGVTLPPDAGAEDLEAEQPPPGTITGPFLAALGGIVVLVAVAVVSEVTLLVLVGIGALAMVAPFLGRLFRYLGATTLAQAYGLAAIYAALTSALVLRRRTAEALVEDPLDAAGRIRILFLCVALLLAAIALYLGPRSAPKVPGFFLFFIGYVVVTSFGIISAVSPLLVAFRTFELSIFCLVFWAAFTVFGGQVWVPLKNVMRFVYLLLASAVLNLVIDRKAAMGEPYGFQDRLKGVFPNLSANYLGYLGCLAAAYGLGQRRIRWLPVVAGTAIVLASLHRTGILAIGVLVILRLVLSRRSVAMFAAVAAVGLVLAVVGLGVVGNVWNRGQPAAEVSTLSARTDWWESGLEALGRSPVVGLGLSSGARFEVFADKGQYVVNVPNLHSTWLEALVGTGVVGVSFVVVAYLGATAGAWRAARRNSYVPFLLLVAVGVNSLTGTTFELASLSTFVLLFAGAAARIPADDQQSVLDSGELGRLPQPALPDRTGTPYP